MFEEELPESDSSDEDFVPTGERSDVSEEESDDAMEEQDSEQNSTNKKKKSKTKSGKSNRKKKNKNVEEKSLSEEIEEEQLNTELNPEAQKKRSDALWADFLKDCGPAKKNAETPQNKQSLSQPVLAQQKSNDDVKLISNAVNETLKTDSLTECSKTNERTEDLPKQEDKTDEGHGDKVVEVYEFAGEKVVVEKKVDPRKRPAPSRGGGVAALLSQINKKSKLSTLEKSKLDWDTFKNKEGISEQLSAHNRGKNGYLEKQDFLERADLRQFEIEKEMRAYSRSKR